MPTPTATITITTIPTQTAGVAFQVTATYALTPGVWQEQLQYQDGVTPAPTPISAAATPLHTSSITFNHPGNLAPGTHTVTVNDRLTGASAVSNAFLVLGGKVITPATPVGVVLNQSFSFTGTIAGYASAPALTWQLDGGALIPFTATNSTSFATPVTITTVGAHVLHVSDGSVTGQTGTITVSAPATFIVPVTPTGVQAGQTFTFTGTISGYLTVPTLTYFFDNAITPIPITGVTLTGWSMVLTAPAAGSHTISISDGTKTIAVPLSVAGPPKVITPFAPPTPTAGQSFTFTGSLGGYTTIPALTYSIDGALPVPMTGVSTTGWSMTIVAPAAGAHTIVVSDGTATGSTQFTVSAVVTGSRKFYESPGMDGSFWVQPFQSSAKWRVSGTDITALRGGTPTCNVKGNFGVPFYIGQATDPLVTVTDGTHSIVVHIPLGAIAETPTSSFDQSIGGVDVTQPYLVWSISGSNINTGSVQASGSVITGTYGFAVNDGAGLMMVDIVTGEPGDNNSIGGIQDFELQKIQSDPNYVIQHMLAFQTDVSFQASAVGPIWPLKITDVSSGGVANPYQGPIPQGITIGIPANVGRPIGKTRGFYALWDQLQQFGMFNYNFGQVGGVNFVIYDASGAFASLVADIRASWIEIGQNYICILDYTQGVSGAQYSLATTKGAIPGSTNAFPAPPPLDLSPTGGVNIAPSRFGAWYPSGYNAIPTNGGPTASFTITPTTPAGVIAGTAFSFTGALSGYTTAPSLTYAINGAAAIALPGVTVTGWSTSITIPAIGVTSIVVLDATHVVSGSTSFQVTDGTVTVVPTTWSAAAALGGITLSNNNYTATSSGSGTPYAAPQGVTATNPVNPGQIVLWEVTADAVTQNFAAGVASASAVLNSTGGMGADTTSIGYYPATGAGSQPPSTVYFGGNQLSAGNGVAATAGMVITFVSNGTNLYVSSPTIRSTSGVTWNSSTTADPIANVGGLSFSSIPTPYYPAFATGESGSGATLNDGTKPLTAFAASFLAANPIVTTISGQENTAPITKTIVPVQPGNVVANAPFTFAGTLTGYATAPSLTYRVDGGTAVALVGETADGWNTTLTIATTGSHTIVVTDGTVTGSTTFTVSAQQTGGGNRVVAPLTGTVTKGTWVTSQHFSLTGSPSGLNYMQYNFLLPAQYDQTKIYPILFVGHPIGSGGNPYPLNGAQFVINASYGANYSLDTMYNGIAFRTAHPCVVVAVQCDQTGNSGGTNANGVPGYNDTGPNGSWNERAEVGIAQAFIAGTIVAGLQVDPAARYHIGYSLGGICTLAQMVDNNQYNGPGVPIWSAGMTFSDQLFRSNASNSSYFSRMTNVPLATFSFTGDNVPGSYDQPAWTAYTGNSNYPSKSTYDSGGMAAVRAGSSNYYYVNNGSSNSATTFMPMNADGGDGTAAYAWLFSQFGPGSVTPTVTITGASLSTNSGPANSAIGTPIGTLAAGATGGTLANVVFSLASQSLAGAFKVVGTSLQFASATVAAGSYTVTITVAASNATNSPQSYSLPVTIAAAGSGFRVSAGKMLTPAGAIYKGKGINITEDQLSTAVTNAACQPMRTLFPGLNLVRLAAHSYVTLAQIQPFVNACTAIQIVVIIENHQNFNAAGGVNGSAGGGQGVILTGAALAKESQWYATLATAFAGNPYVWWGTNNEPSVVDPATGQNNVPLLSTWHLATYNAIRNTGNKAPVLFNLNWITTFGVQGGMTASVYAQMTNAVWDLHFYNVLSNYSTNATTILNTQLLQNLATLGTLTSRDGVIPTISAEYGNSTNGTTVDPGGVTNCVVLQQQCDNHTLVGCAAWIWDNFGTGAADQLRSGSSLTLSVPYGQQVAGWINTGVLTPPAVAAAVGYTLLTYGPDLVLGKTVNPATSYPLLTGGVNIVPFTFFGTSWTNIGCVQNSDGSVTMDGSGQAFGNGLCTAIVGTGTPSRTNFQGVAFGGGLYVEAVMKGNGPMSFWANDIETMNGSSQGLGTVPWPGQAAGYGDWLEPDIAEFDTTGNYGWAFHNWYATTSDIAPQWGGPLNNFNGPPAGVDFTQYHRYGALWVPATATTSGYMQYYFDGNAISNKMQWNLYNPSLAPPPVVGALTNTRAGPYPSNTISDTVPNTAWSVLDTRHLAFICGANPGATVTFQSITVWQGAGANNIHG